MCRFVEGVLHGVRRRDNHTGALAEQEAMTNDEEHDCRGNQTRTVLQHAVLFEAYVEQVRREVRLELIGVDDLQEAACEENRGVHDKRPVR